MKYLDTHLYNEFKKIFKWTLLTNRVCLLCVIVMTDFWTILVYLLAIWAGIYLISYIVRHPSLEIGPFMIFFRTKRFNKFINSIARKFSFIWRLFAPVGVLISLVLMVYGFYFLVYNIFSYLFLPQDALPVQPLIPGVTISFSTLTYLLIPLAIILFTHELMHGIIARLNGMRIKSSGLFMIFVLPGGFVEIDEQDLYGSSIESRERVFAAGSFINIITAIFALLLIINFTLVISPFFTPSNGILIASVTPNSPAENVLHQWDILYGINGTQFGNLTAFYSYMDHVRPGDLLILNTSRGIIAIYAGHHPSNTSRGFIGILPFPYYKPIGLGQLLGVSFPYHLYSVLNWLWILALNLAVFNMLPIPPLDGDKLLYALLERVFQRNTVNKAMNYIRTITFTILLVNILFTFFSGGFMLL